MSAPDVPPERDGPPPGAPGDHRDRKAASTADILRLLAEDEPGAGGELFRRLYQELHGMAASHLAGQRPSHTLQATALVHEAFLKITQGQSMNWESRRHFLSVASKAMRQILVDHARSRSRLKRSTAGERVVLDSIVDDLEERSRGLLAFDDALAALAESDPQAAKIVELRFYLGMTVAETARALDVPERRVEREWASARAWLRRRLG